jgi:DNA-binding NarL/FixJ family response regulator
MLGGSGRTVAQHSQPPEDPGLELTRQIRNKHPETMVLVFIVRNIASREPPDPAAVYRLTAQERDVLALVAMGVRNREIAQRLTITEHSVKVHVRRILAKVDAENRAEAT